MKLFGSIFIMLIYLLQPIQLAGDIVRFKLNQDYIARVLCINKDKPELKCNGKCHLKKVIKKKTEEKERAPLNVRIKTEVQIAEEPFSFDFNYLLFLTSEHNLFGENLYRNYFRKKIFHPPAFTLLKYCFC